MYFFSYKKFQTQLHKGFDPSAVCSRTIFKLQFVQEQCKLTINYCCPFFYTFEIFFDISLCIKQMLSWLENMHKYVKNEFEGGEKNSNFKFCERWRIKKSLTCIGTIIVKWIWWNLTYQNINSFLVFRWRSIMVKKLYFFFQKKVKWNISSYQNLSHMLSLFWNESKMNHEIVKFIHSEKSTKFCDISNTYLSYVLPVKWLVEILQNFVAFSEYMNFNFKLMTFDRHFGSIKLHYCRIIQQALL